MQRRQFVASAVGVCTAVSGCLEPGLGETDEIEPYDFEVENQTDAQQRATVTIRRDGDVLFEQDLDLTAHATWEFKGPLEGDGTAFVIVTANGDSATRTWSRPDGSGFLRANIRTDGVELTAAAP